MGPKGKVKKNIWYQVYGREVSYVELPAGGQYIQLCKAIKQEENLEVPASTLTLKAKKVDETEYTTLNVDFFHDECGNDFNKLISKFKIKQTNPIKVKYLATASENEEIKKLKEELDALKISQETISSPMVAISSTSSAHASSNEIHVRYENQSFSFNKNVLEAMGISNIEDLTEVIKFQLKKSIKDVSDKVITLRRGENDFMDPETSISGLYNTEDQALHVIVVNVPTINLTVKTSKKDFYFYNQHISSHDEIIKFIKSREVLTQFITDNTIFLGDDEQPLSPQHLFSAQESGTFNITLTDPYIDTVSHKEILEKAFNCQFRDPNNMKERFLNYLNKKYMTWKSDANHRVPYSTIFQSSGYGKSRLVKEVARGIPTIYLCLRDVRSTGYPLRTSVGANLFERVLEDIKEGEEWRFLYILQIAIQCFKEELAECDNNCEKLWNSQMDTAFCERVWGNIQHKSENWRNIYNYEVNNSADFIFDNDSSSVTFLLCIDEASTLISSTSKTSPFRLLRRALRKIKWNGFFVLLLDTLSKISNFAPPKSIDPSSRDTSELPLKLFYPYFRLTTMDVFEPNNYEDEYWNLAKFGRPLYISYLQSCKGDTEAINKLKNLLERKLLGGANNFEESRQDISSLAILSSIIGFDMSPQSQLASELVASHMATCVSVSEDRERLIITYPTEPVLSDVALDFMSDSMLPKILKQFNILLKKGFVEPGPRGEIVSRIILAIVAYKLKTGINKSVQKFLEELYHEDSMPNLDGFSDKFINGTVSYTHFNAIEYVPEKEDLEWFYTRKCAFIMKRNHPGADICIPVKLATDTDKYSLIIVQIKNIDTTSIKSDKKYPGSAKSMLDCSYVFQKSDLKDHDEPCLCLYWQLGYHYYYMESPSTVSTRRSESSLNLCWATFGLKHYKIDNIEDILIDILTSHISPFDIEWQVDNEEEGDIYYEDEIRIMNPRKYKKEIEL